MKKKIVAMMLVGMMAVSMTACGGGEETKQEASKTESTSAEQSEPVEEEKSSDEGEVIEENGMRKEPVFTNKELNITGTTGTFNYTIEGIQVSKLTATTDEMASILQIEKGKEVTLVAVNASAENTSDETMNFYIGQATLTSDTKEQVEADMFFSEYIDGEFLGNVIHSGNMIYILKNTAAEDLGEVTLHIPAPSDANYENTGDPLQIAIPVK